MNSEAPTTTPAVADIDINQVIACPDCDLLLEKIPVATGEKLCCPRCGDTLREPKTDSINRTLALALTGLLLFPFAIFMPIMTLNTMGLENSGNIFDEVIMTWDTGYRFIALIVALTTIIFPLIKLLLLFLISLSLKFKRYHNSLRLLMRSYIHLDEWGMLEVFMIGILVTIIKMHHMATIQYDVGLFCFIGLLAAALGSSLMMDKDEFWKLIENGERRNQRHRGAEAEGTKFCSNTDFLEQVAKK